MARPPRLRRIFSTTYELMQAANEGDPQAQNELGTAYATGSGVKQNRLQAFKLWLQAAEGGDPVAMERVAETFRTGEVLLEKVTPIDLPRAIAWYQKSAKGGNHDALFGLARVYQQQQEFRLALETFKESAYTYGKRESLREYGLCIFHGNGTLADMDEGRRLIAQAAQMDPDYSELGAKYLGQNYGVKIPLPKDDAEREQRAEALARFQFDCLQKRAEKGDTDAQVELAHKYIFGGKSFEMNREKSYYWFARAAEAGDAEAQFEMGRAAESGGAGRPKDAAEAFKWFSKSAAQNYRDGLREAGRCLYLGEGTPADHKRAAEFFERAVKQRDTESMVFLGKMLQDGTAVKKDPARGQALIDRALEEDRKGIGLARIRLMMLKGVDEPKPKKKK
ncbi:MAG TPA: tetratricopeptide repeat protein [Patescibacteria group bacterium]|nr:tetratricopeptide repeat protein [Patescibacteria group bacterium]